MKTYQVWFSNGSSVLVRAMDKIDARETAKWMSGRDGYPNLIVMGVAEL